MTHYEILGVSKTASQEEIKSAYKSLVKKYHPDLYQGDKNFAEKKTKEINVAYDILSNAEKKAEYDSIITPSYTSSSSSNNQNYGYTPPKYSSSYNPYSSYSNYKNNHSSQYSNSNYNKQTYTNSYNNSYKKDTREVIYDEFAKKLGANLAVVFGVFIIYLIIFIATLMQYKSYKDSTKKSTSNKIYVTNTIDEDNYDDEFDINDYFSDSELLELYNKYYRDIFDSFSEFKEAYSLYIQKYYNF